MLCVMIDPDRGFLKITVAGLGDVDEFLRISVDQREPTALYLPHYAMSFEETMRQVIEHQLNRRNLIGREWFRPDKTIPEFPPQHLRPHQQLRLIFVR